jgi:hypothetical protein
MGVLIAITGWSPVAKSNRRRELAFRALASAAIKYNVPLVITSPSKLLGGKYFSGWTCSKQNGNIIWGKSMWSLTPKAVVYDAMYLRDLKSHRSSYRRLLVRLRQDKTLIFNPVLPAKDELYRVLTKSKIDGGRLPRTVTSISPAGVLRMLDGNNRLWLKPVFGSGGRNIAFIERQPSGKYLVVVERHRNRRLQEELGRAGLLELVRQLTRHRTYMAQEHVDLASTPDGRKIDFRITVQRKDTGAWDVTATTVRLGAPGSVLTNFHAGGKVRSLTRADESREFLEGLGVTPTDIHQMKQLALRVARRLQSYYPSLGILGLDVGHTQAGEFFVYDFNGRPGRDILTDEEVVRFMDSVAGYARYLSDLRKHKTDAESRR